jgi:hypothetical protein
MSDIGFVAGILLFAVASLAGACAVGAGIAALMLKRPGIFAAFVSAVVAGLGCLAIYAVMR